MQEERAGLKRSLNAGDSVILSSGATATVRESYPAGYSGLVAILLEGVEENESSESLTIVEWNGEPSEPGPEPDNVQPGDEARGQSRRMEH
jgi:hypothetical protein